MSQTKRCQSVFNQITHNPKNLKVVPKGVSRQLAYELVSLGTYERTQGGLTAKDIVKNKKNGRYISKKKREVSTKLYNQGKIGPHLSPSKNSKSKPKTEPKSKPKSKPKLKRSSKTKQ
jgi:hypothetical protein